MRTQRSLAQCRPGSKKNGKKKGKKRSSSSGSDFSSQSLKAVTPELEAVAGAFLQERSAWFSSLRFVRSDEDVDKAVNDCVKISKDFAFAMSYAPDFVARCTRAGFLPMAIPVASNMAVFAPKLHQKRCVLEFGDLHISKSTRKKQSVSTPVLTSALITASSSAASNIAPTAGFIPTSFRPTVRSTSSTAKGACTAFAFTLSKFGRATGR